MKKFSEMLEALPGGAAQQIIWTKRIYIGQFACGIVYVLLLGAGWYLDNLTIVAVAYIPIILVTCGLIGQLIIEARDVWKMIADSAGWLGRRLDRRFEEEKQAASGLAGMAQPELRSLAARIDTEITAQEKWLDVLKPMTLLVPAILIITGSKLLNLGEAVQNTTQVGGAALIIGLAIGAVSMYSALVKMRRLSSVLHYAIAADEEKKAVRFRKVSRKRTS
jgi:hypothetical protein